MPIYVSADGLEKLKQEYADRSTRVRKEIAEKISGAKELGDLSENFEYHEAKDTQGQNESRIIELEGMIKDAEVVLQQTGGNAITLGSHFTVEMKGTKRTFEIVGFAEADPVAGRISNESPIGQAFIGHNVGEVVEVAVPSGTMKYKILKIE